MTTSQDEYQRLRADEERWARKEAQVNAARRRREEAAQRQQRLKVTSPQLGLGITPAMIRGGR